MPLIPPWFRCSPRAVAACDSKSGPFLERILTSKAGIPLMLECLLFFEILRAIGLLQSGCDRRVFFDRIIRLWRSRCWTGAATDAFHNHVERGHQDQR
jgi:hypothetical protein